MSARQREAECFEVQLLGVTLTVRTDKDEQTIRRIEEFANRRLAEVSRGSATVSSQHVAMLTILTLAEELLETREARQDDLERIGAMRIAIDKQLETLRCA